MKEVSKRKHRMLAAVAAGSLLLTGLGGAAALADTGAVKALTNFDVNDSSILKNAGIVIGGWANGGITYNAANPRNNFNGPVTFGDRAEEFQLNQLNMFIQRAVAAEGSSWDLGFRFDVMFGTDSIFTQAYGIPAGPGVNRGNWDLNLLGSNSNRFYDLALPQAYLETYIPVGNGLNLKAGHFYTPIGYESVPAPDNFFYTHAYTMQYGEPFTHTGLLGNYAVDSNWSVMGGVLTGSATGGWDGSFNKQVGNWSGIGGATWTSDDKNTSANVSGTYGGTSETNSHAWGIYSIVLKHNFTDKTHLMVQHDQGYANHVSAGPVDANGANTPVDAQWYGLNTHFYYDLHEQLTVGLRGEWFRDQNGYRVCAPGRIGAATDSLGNSFAAGGATNYCSSNLGHGVSYYAFTLGLNWKPYPWLRIRPNVRYDWADGTASAASNATNNGICGPGQYKPFGNCKQDQFLFSTDFTVNF